MKKPKKLKMPKKPKRGASVTTLRNYLKRCREVEASNRTRLSKFLKEKRERESLRKKIYG